MAEKTDNSSTFETSNRSISYGNQQDEDVVSPVIQGITRLEVVGILSLRAWKPQILNARCPMYQLEC